MTSSSMIPYLLRTLLDVPDLPFLLLFSQSGFELFEDLSSSSTGSISMPIERTSIALRVTEVFLTLSFISLESY